MLWCVATQRIGHLPQPRGAVWLHGPRAGLRADPCTVWPRTPPSPSPARLPPVSRPSPDLGKMTRGQVCGAVRGAQRRRRAKPGGGQPADVRGGNLPARSDPPQGPPTACLGPVLLSTRILTASAIAELTVQVRLGRRELQKVCLVTEKQLDRVRPPTPADARPAMAELTRAHASARDVRRRPRSSSDTFPSRLTSRQTPLPSRSHRPAPPHAAPQPRPTPETRHPQHQQRAPEDRTQPQHPLLRPQLLRLRLRRLRLLRLRLLRRRLRLRLRLLRRRLRPPPSVRVRATQPPRLPQDGRSAGAPRSASMRWCVFYPCQDHTRPPL